jgi:redox-sensitive bicupin YhaK (pirin superfamily)
MESGADLRPVRMTVRATEAREGAGFLVRRSFPTRVIEDLDPFLLLDEMGPIELGPGEAKGAPDHPHRGFETVTYLLAGELVHRDSHGHAGRLAPGDVQWMTAGAGVVHSELPGERLLAEGGRMHGVLLWVNLPRREKRARPRYQDLRAAAIPVAPTPDGLVEVRVIAGEALGVSAPTRTHTPILYLHASLAAGGRIVQPVPSGWNAFAYVFAGVARVGREERAARPGDLVVLAAEGGAVSLRSDEGAEVLLAAGEPLGEPVVRYGPFVMNAEEEIVEAFEDYRAGRMGAIPAEGAEPSRR